MSRTVTDAVMSSVAVIPARGGSKRIARKNIRPFLGVPLLARTIEILRAADVFDRIIVSTDDAEISAVARGAGADLPFTRPAALATDTAPTIPVIAHAISELAAMGSTPSFVCCVYPAAVLMQPSHYRESFELLRTSDADYVFTATAYAYPIQRALRPLGGGGCEMFFPEYRETRSQDLASACHDAGQFYWGRRQAWLDGLPIFSNNSRLFLLPHSRVQDIDTEEDWQRAELIFELSRHERSRG